MRQSVPQEAQAADAVADGDLACGLILAYALKDLLQGLAALRKALLDPGDGKAERRARPAAGSPARSRRDR